MSTAQVRVNSLGKSGLGEVAGAQYACRHFGIPEVILAPIKVPPIPHTFQSELVNKTKRQAPLLQKVGEVTPKVSTCLYGKDNPAAVSFDYLSPRLLQHFLEAIPGIHKFELGSDHEIFSYGYCCVFLFVWVDSYRQISGRNLPDFPCFVVEYQTIVLDIWT
jgi:hypothetical protein